MNQPPSTGKIVRTDYLAAVLTVVLLSFWGIYILLVITGDIPLTLWAIPMILAVISAVLLILLVWRVRGIQGVFSRGREATATVREVRLGRKALAQVAYRYSYLGQDYESRDILMATQRIERRLKRLSPGVRVTVVVDSRQPRKALLRDVYQ
ncbi:MAG: hypothetical protein D6784_15105 [Chloroflexi bacterium]|nr:MAG: hypothetical protein D6784_15105 [Chloroflexota bacterium]